MDTPAETTAIPEPASPPPAAKALQPSSAPPTSLEVRGPSIPIPSDVDAHSFIFQSRLRGITNPFEVHGFPNHTFDGEEVPAEKMILFDHRSGTSVSFGRLEQDSIKVAVSLLRLTGPPLTFDRRQPEQILHAPRTTLLLHLPNCIPFAVLMLGAMRGHLTFSPISSMLTVNEIAYTLAKSRPGVVVTWRSVKSGDRRTGKDCISGAVQVLLDDSLAEDVLSKSQRAEAQQWAEKFQAELDERLVTVDLEADYYGTNLSLTTGQRADLDAQDWTHLLSSSPDAQHLLPSTKMSRKEQSSRAALLLWSSGTTGLPKAVLLGHRYVISQCIAQWSKPHLIGPRRKGGERWTSLAPWCHVFGLASFLIAGIACGATLIIPRPGSRFDLRQYLLMLSHYRVTSASVAPPVVFALRKTPLLDPKSPSYLGNLDLTALSVLIAGGAAVSPEIIRAVDSRLQTYVQMGYGTTETGGVTQCMAVKLDEGPFSGLSEVGSCGPPLPNTEIRIDCSGAGTISAEEAVKSHVELLKSSAENFRRGEAAPQDPCPPGEILVKGDSLLLGYYSGSGGDDALSSPLDTAPCTGPFNSEGWYRTGDWGCLDARGNLWILGRSKDTFKVRGFQVSPVELESIFAKHDALADVAACGMKLQDISDNVSGARQDGTEEVPVLFVQPSSAAVWSSPQAQSDLVRDLSEWIRPRTAYYKYPRYYVFVEGIEKNPTGKILRRMLPGALRRAKSKARVFAAASVGGAGSVEEGQDTDRGKEDESRAKL